MNLMVYGDSGVGKTQLAGSADEVPDLRPVLVLDFEGGTETLVRTYPDIDMIRIETWEQMQKVYDDLYKGSHGYSTVILDSLTEIQKFNMYTVMEKLLEAHPDRDIDVPSMREWGKNLEQMRKFVRAFRDLPMNTVFTALKKEDRNDTTGRVTTKPSLSGKMGDEVAGFLDVVLYYYIKNTRVDGNNLQQRLLLTAKTESIIAKDRTGALPTIVQEPTMQKLYELFLAQRATNQQ
jgi:hypothetical protein